MEATRIFLSYANSLFELTLIKYHTHIAEEFSLCILLEIGYGLRLYIQQ